MRARFSAYALEDAAFLLRSWHPSTRPARLTLDAGLVWRRLQIVDVVDGADSAEVAFRASYRQPDGAPGLLEERSVFLRGGPTGWQYVSGTPLQ